MHTAIGSNLIIQLQWMQSWDNCLEGEKVQAENHTEMQQSASHMLQLPPFSNSSSYFPIFLPGKSLPVVPFGDAFVHV